MEHDAAFADVRIAILDDNRNFQNLMRGLLRSMGFRRVDVFADPFEARAFVVSTPVDLAFVDLIMPRQNGVDWVRHARRTSLLANPAMAIALVTGHAGRRVIDQAVVAGVDDVLAKPLSPATLHRHILRLLRRPHPYVRGANGYFGPNLRGAHDGRALTDARAAVAARFDPHGARRFSVPGLHVELRPRGLEVEQAFLD